jgi:hypothetical protein
MSFPVSEVSGAKAPSLQKRTTLGIQKVKVAGGQAPSASVPPLAWVGVLYADRRGCQRATCFFLSPGTEDPDPLGCGSCWAISVSRSFSFPPVTHEDYMTTDMLHV